MKKFIVIVNLLVVLSTLLCACTQPEKPTSAVTEPTTEPITEPIDESSWQLGDDYIVTPKGVVYEAPCYLKEIATTDEVVLIHDCYRAELWLCTETSGFSRIGERVVQYTRVFDKLYWLDLDRTVWVANWANGETAELYCRDAIAVSPFVDEGQGAIVDPERATGIYYGLPVYSPYD